jgi:hypothetical protein
MVNYGVVVAVASTMVCKTNEIVQREGCNVLGTMGKTFVENGFKFDHTSRHTLVVDIATNDVVL